MEGSQNVQIPLALPHTRALQASTLSCTWQLRPDWCLILMAEKWIPDVVSGSSAMLRQGCISPPMPHTNAILPITKIIICLISPPPFLSLPSVHTHTHTHTSFFSLACQSQLSTREKAELHSSVSPERSQIADANIWQVTGIFCLGQ